MKALGICGHSGCGKTTLITALIPRLRARGLTVSTIKHTHHDADLDAPEKDTWRHREAGAQEVILATRHRWALLHELRETPEPSLTELLTRLQPVDVVLVEGWKSGTHPKLEIWRPAAVAAQQPHFQDDPNIIAAACDPLINPASYGRPDFPVFPLADLEHITDFLVQYAAKL